MNYGVKQVCEKSVPMDLKELSGFGITLVVAPHPDDESLGCGGILALLTEMGNQVHVVFVSDGCMSHPGSKKYPAPALATLRAAEARVALSVLGIPATNAHFMGIKDSNVPMPGSTGFEAAVVQMQQLIHSINCHTIIFPWRRDPHRDHIACWHLVQHTAGPLSKIKLFEYPVWMWERATEADKPKPGEIRYRCIDISRVLVKKQKAVAAHRSQVTKLIDDDPQGFYLSPGLLRHFKEPFEVLMENV